MAEEGGADGPFPPHWEFDVVLADGGTVHIRPLLPSDRGPYLELFDRLSEETRYARFLSPKRELSDAEVAHFLEVDMRDRMALVAFAGEQMIAVARYDRLADGADAEVAFVIDDAHQGRGLGTLMLEYLAAAGRERGVSRFVAETLPGNRRMLSVFHDAGYQTVDHFADGVVEVEFPIAATDEARAVVEGREHRAEARSIERLLTPGSVAVIGASRHRGSIGHHLFLNLLAGGFEGPVHPVNPAAEHVASVPAVASVLDVPGEVDLAVVAVPAEAVRDVVEQCGEKGVKGLIVVSNGFREAGPEGAVLEREVLETARRYGMRLVGPNCMGVANTAIGLNATFAPTELRPGRVAFLTQSGALGIAVLEWTARLGIGISSFASIGNKADVSGNDLLQYWEDDPDTDVVLLYLESFGNPRKFARLARRVSARKPIVAVKAARTSAGERAATSHTAAAPSSDDAVTALFRQAGVIRVETLEELLDVTELLSSQPLPAGRRVAIVGNSGGPGILAADACVGAGLDVVTLSEATQAALRALLGPRAAVANPVDMIASATAADYEQAIRLVLADEVVDSLIVLFTPPLASGADEVAEAIARGAEGASQPVLANFLASTELPAALAGGDGRRRIPTYPSPEPAAIALGRVATHAEWRRRDPGVVPDPDGVDRDRARELVARAAAAPATDAAEGRWLDPAEVAELLGCYGIPTAEVAPGAEGPDEVRPMVGAEGVETVVGLVQDPAFGPLVMVGMGGVATELLADRTFRILPITDRDAAEMVRALRASPLLFGYRGAAAVAVECLEDLLVRVGLMADDLPEVRELDLNPVVVGERAATAVGARVRVGPAGPVAPDLVRRLRA